jgi:hypothetical protein
MGMTRHRLLLAEVVERLRRSEMECGVILFGSVQRSEERPDSDLDLCLVVRNRCDLRDFDPTVLHREKGMTLFESRLEGVVVHFACWPTEALEKAVSEEPFTYYPLARGQIVCDPHGLATRFQRRLQEYFREHPAVASAWEEQLAAFRQYKAGTASSLQYAEWGDFAAHIGELIEEAEQD